MEGKWKYSHSLLRTRACRRWIDALLLFRHARHCIVCGPSMELLAVFAADPDLCSTWSHELRIPHQRARCQASICGSRVRRRSLFLPRCGPLRPTTSKLSRWFAYSDSSPLSLEPFARQRCLCTVLMGAPIPFYNFAAYWMCVFNIAWGGEHGASRGRFGTATSWRSPCGMPSRPPRRSRRPWTCTAQRGPPGPPGRLCF